MDNTHKSGDKTDIDTSDYIYDPEASRIDLGGIFSRQFSNISTLYVSPAGPAILYTATRYGKRFVLKGIKDEFINDPIYNLALAKEFEIGISLDHPNIRRTIGLENVDGIGKVIVMEYVDGAPLSDLIASGKLSRSKARDIAAQIAQAMAYIHSKHIYHRDLKPSNIIVAHQGNSIKIIDFNLSDSDAFIVLKNPAGSKKYMAPELFSTNAVHTAAADIYSLGVIMNELAAASRDELLAEAAERCTQADPQRRPQNISEINLPPTKPTTLQSLYALLSSRSLTLILTIVCLLLAAYIVYFLTNHVELWTRFMP